MKYAVIKLGGKQLKIKEGETFKIERQDGLNYDVIAYVNEELTLLGTPVLKDVKVLLKVIGEEKGDKVRVARFKAKSRYRKLKGHRQPLSVVKVEGISKEGEVPAVKVTKVKAKTVESKEKTVKTKKTAVKTAKTAVKKAVKKVVKKGGKE